MPPAQVLKDGRLQRFCQQCSHFHGLDAFDGTRRSCREQLAAHNARRRKRVQPNRPRSEPAAGAAASEAPELQLAEQQEHAAPKLKLPKASKAAAVAAAVAQHEAVVQPVPAVVQPVPAVVQSAVVLPRPAVVLQQPAVVQPVQQPAVVQQPQPWKADPDQAQQQALQQQQLALQQLQVLQRGAQPSPQVQALQAQPQQPQQQAQQQPQDPQQPSYQEAAALFQAVAARPERLPALKTTLLGMLAGAGAGAGAAQQAASAARAYASPHRVVRLSAKLFNCTPADLPACLRQQMAAWLGSPPLVMEGYIRPGCVLLTVHMVAPAAPCGGSDLGGGAGGCSELGGGGGGGDAAMLERLLSALVVGGPPDSIWRRGTALLQLGAEVAVVQHGQVLQRASYTREAALQQGLPVLLSSGPVVLCAAAAAAGSQPPGSGASFRLEGFNLAQPGVQVVVRSGGQHVRPAAVVPLPPPPGAAPGVQQLQVSLPPLPPGCHLLHAELQRGGYLSAALPLLLLDSPALAGELQRGAAAAAAAAAAAGGSEAQQACWAAAAEDLGMVLQYGAGGGGGAVERRHWSRTAQALLQFACQQGLGGTARALLPHALEGALSL